MTLKATSRIGLPAGTKDVRLERVDSDTVYYSHHFWKLWLSYDKTMEFGTYLALYDDGSIDRVTVHPDGWEQTINIKPPSKGD